LDISTFTVTIQVGAGTYTGTVRVAAPWVGSGTVALTGDKTTPANVIISTTSNDAIRVSGGGRLNLGGFKVQTTTSGNSVLALGGSITIDGAMDYGACAGFQIYAQTFGNISISANYTVSGGAVAHMLGSSLSAISANGRTVTISTAVAITYFAYSSRLSSLDVASMTFTNPSNVTGARYLADTNAVIYVSGGGASYFPGTIAGSASTGAQYI